MGCLWYTNLWPPQYPDIAPLDFFLLRYVKDYIYGTSVDVTAILHARKIKEIQSVAECWPINRQNWAITLMWIRPLGAPMLRWTRARKTFWVKEHLQIIASTYLYWLKGNKFLKQTQDLWVSHTCQTENNDKVFLGYISRIWLPDRGVEKTIKQNLPTKPTMPDKI
jgi:hypothetical protein